VVGILGGSAGTTLDAFQLIHDARKHGAKVALFGRKINLSESPLAFIEFLRRVVDGEITPVDAVKAYHGVLQHTGIKPQRSLQQDLQLTTNKMSYK
jgi:DhnA family fructose-bisphosphate aldolase class Ia